MSEHLYTSTVARMEALSTSSMEDDDAWYCLMREVSPTTLCVGHMPNGRIVISTSVPLSEDALAVLGYEPVTQSFNEFENPWLL